MYFIVEQKRLYELLELNKIFTLILRINCDVLFTKEWIFESSFILERR